MDYTRNMLREQDNDWLLDCSSGCWWYLPLEGELGMDWGVCANPRSHRCGLLTHEHQGCAMYELAGGAEGER